MKQMEYLFGTSTKGRRFHGSDVVMVWILDPSSHTRESVRAGLVIKIQEER
jgi:predicted nucleotidyltransferase